MLGIPEAGAHPPVTRSCGSGACVLDDAAAELLQLTLHIGLDLVQAFHLLVVCVEVVLVHFVDEHFISYARLHLMSRYD